MPTPKAVTTILCVVGALQAASLAAQQTVEKPRVTIVATGGTIANSPAGRMAVDAFLEQIPGLGDFADIRIRDYARIASSDMSPQNWIEIAQLITEELAEHPETDGIVVTHGSNTSEETAYFLNLM